jgi:hypothetical protein
LGFFCYLGLSIANQLLIHKIPFEGVKTAMISIFIGHSSSTLRACALLVVLHLRVPRTSKPASATPPIAPYAFGDSGQRNNGMNGNAETMKTSAGKL